MARIPFGVHSGGARVAPLQVLWADMDATAFLQMAQVLLPQKNAATAHQRLVLQRLIPLMYPQRADQRALAASLQAYSLAHEQHQDLCLAALHSVIGHLDVTQDDTSALLLGVVQTICLPLLRTKSPTCAMYPLLEMALRCAASRGLLYSVFEETLAGMAAAEPSAPQYSLCGILHAVHYMVQVCARAHLCGRARQGCAECSAYGTGGGGMGGWA